MYTSLRKLINVTHFFGTFIRYIFVNKERCRKDPAIRGKENNCISFSFGKGDLRKDLVLEMSQKEFILEKACDKMAACRCKWEGQGWCTTGLN